MSPVSQSAYVGNLYVPLLLDNGAKARFGAAYVRAVCSQAGAGFKETSLDEDVAAVDGDIQFRQASAYVQIKCTSQYPLSRPRISWSVKPEWRSKWDEFWVPVYFILVVLDTPLAANWLEHSSNGTMFRAAAYWTRVNGSASSVPVVFESNKRLTIETIKNWNLDLRQCFTAGAIGA